MVRAALPPPSEGRRSLVASGWTSTIVAAIIRRNDGKIVIKMTSNIDIDIDAWLRVRSMMMPTPPGWRVLRPSHPAYAAFRSCDIAPPTWIVWAYDPDPDTVPNQPDIQLAAGIDGVTGDFFVARLPPLDDGTIRPPIPAAHDIIARYGDAITAMYIASGAEDWSADSLIQLDFLAAAQAS